MNIHPPYSASGRSTVIMVLNLLLTVITSQLFAQHYTQSLRGRVLDKDSKIPIVSASVIISTTNPVLGEYTAINGEFIIKNIPVGRHTILVQCIGYNPAILNNIIISTGKELFLNIELEPKVTTIRTITITDSSLIRKRDNINSMISISAQTFSPEETNRYAGSRIDPSRMVANFAGVFAGNDSRNEVIVRGNSPLGVLWRLEGIDIPNPNHFTGQGASGGALSILNNNLLSASDFLTGAFPADYGNKIAAAFDLRLRNGNNKKYEFTSAMGINGLEAGIEGPFTKRSDASFLINYRYSTFALFDALGLQFGVSGVPTYQDGTVKINIPVGLKHNLSLFAIGGYSNVDVLDSKRDSADWQFTSGRQNIRYGSAMYAAGISHTWFISGKTYSKLTVSRGFNRLRIKVDTLLNATDIRENYLNRTNEYTNAIQYLWSTKFNEKNTLRLQARYTLYTFSYLENYYENLFKQTLTLADFSGDAALVNASVQWQHRFSNALKLNTGIYAQQFLLNNSRSVEPRAGLVYTRGNHTYRLGYGLHSQMQPLVIYFFKSYVPSTDTYVETNRSLGFTKAHHLVAGYQWAFLSNWILKSEAYMQYLFNVPVHKYYINSVSVLNLGGDVGFPNFDSLANRGLGRNYGLELTLEKMFSKGYYFLGNISLFNSEYRGSDLLWRYTKFSNHYVLNILSGYEFNFGKQHKNAFTVDGRIGYAGGIRYTPIDLEQSQVQNRQVLVDEKAFSKQYPSYFRADIKVAFKINTRSITHSLFITVENITNHRNILQQFYQPNTGQVRTDYQLGRFPYGGYRIEF